MARHGSTEEVAEPVYKFWHNGDFWAEFFIVGVGAFGFGLGIGFIVLMFGS